MDAEWCWNENDDNEHVLTAHMVLCVRRWRQRRQWGQGEPQWRDGHWLRGNILEFVGTCVRIEFGLICHCLGITAGMGVERKRILLNSGPGVGSLILVKAWQILRIEGWSGTFDFNYVCGAFHFRRSWGNHSLWKLWCWWRQWLEDNRMRVVVREVTFENMKCGEDTWVVILLIVFGESDIKAWCVVLCVFNRIWDFWQHHGANDIDCYYVICEVMLVGEIWLAV